MPTTEATKKIVSDWFENIGKGDMDAVIAALAEDVVFELPVQSRSRVIDYLGTHRGRDAVLKAFQLRGAGNQIVDYGLKELVCEGNVCYARIYTKACYKPTGQEYEITDAHRLEVDAQGYLSSWRVFFDPEPEVAAYLANRSSDVITATRARDAASLAALLATGGNPNEREPSSGLNLLMIAAGQGDANTLKLLLDHGADLYTIDAKGGASALHKAIQGGNLDCVKLLLEAGAFVDWAACTTGHTPLMDAFWFKFPDLVACLLEHNAGLNMGTHYGFTFRQHIDFELKANAEGRATLEQAVALIDQRAASDQQRAARQTLMAAVVAGELAEVQRLLAAGAEVDERYPFFNGFNDAHTPLLVACREGHTGIVGALLNAGADVNAVEPTFGAVPLHKAVYNGHADITALLVGQAGIDLDFQGITNGYTPLHDALWHGYEDCARLLLGAGARLELRGHDGKRPLDIAVASFGTGHPLTREIAGRTPA